MSACVFVNNAKPLNTGFGVPAIEMFTAAGNLIFSLSTVAENAEGNHSYHKNSNYHADRDDNAEVHVHRGRFHTLELIIHHLLASTLFAKTGGAGFLALQAGTNFLIGIGDDALLHPTVDNHLTCALLTFPACDLKLTLAA